MQMPDHAWQHAPVVNYCGAHVTIMFCSGLLTSHFIETWLDETIARTTTLAVFVRSVKWNGGGGEKDSIYRGRKRGPRGPDATPEFRFGAAKFKEFKRLTCGYRCHCNPCHCQFCSCRCCSSPYRSWPSPCRDAAAGTTLKLGGGGGQSPGIQGNPYPKLIAPRFGPLFFWKRPKFTCKNKQK